MILNISACDRVQSVTVTMFSNKQVTSSFVYLEKETSNLFGGKRERMPRMQWKHRYPSFTLGLECILQLKFVSNPHVECDLICEYLCEMLRVVLGYAQKGF